MDAENYYNLSKVNKIDTSEADYQKVLSRVKDAVTRGDMQVIFTKLPPLNVAKRFVDEGFVWYVTKTNMLCSVGWYTLSWDKNKKPKTLIFKIKKFLKEIFT